MGRGRRSESLPKGQEANTGDVKVEGGIGAFNLQEAPVYYPTDEEFASPLGYISQIRQQAEVFGLCRIVPPTSWNPPFGLDTVKFTFPTKLQAIHHLQERPAACDAETFKLEYSRFLRKLGETLERWPTLNGDELDLCKLFNAVKRHGGHEKVTSENRWGEVVRMVAAGDPATLSSSSISSTLRQLYEKYLSTFEVYQTKLGAGKRWRAKAKQESAEKHGNKPKRGGRKRLSGGGGDADSSAENKKDDSVDNELCEVLLPASEVEPRSEGKRTGRRRQSGGEVDLEELGESRKSESVENDLAEVLRPPADTETRPQTAQRKRRKTEEKFAIEEGLGRTDQICEQCNSGAHEQLMLLCDRCDRGWHLYCLSPPLSSVPVGNWYCLECLGSESESFGFGQGQEYSFESFRRMADRFKRKWFGTRPCVYADLEKEFWRVVEGGTAPVEVLYGSDLDTGVYGSGFPRASDPVPPGCDAQAWDAGAMSPWNVNNFPKLEGSMLRLVHDNIPGVMVPWLYIGMLFSSFCWHYEDHCFYSVNYLHCGEPKSWYSVPGSASDAFEKVMRSAFPDLFEAQPDLLFQLVTMLNPTVLRDNGVPVCTTIQEPGNFVITFPRSYHGGFNHGFNCAEAVNFAPSDWLPYGGFGVERYRLYHKAAVLSHDELLCVIAKNDESCVRSPWLQQELSRVVAKERSQREYLWSHGMVKSSRMPPRTCQDHIGAEEDDECIICRYYLHLSAVVCLCRPNKAVCLQHARQLCECSADQQSLLYRFTLAELDDLIGKDDQTLEDSKVGDLAAVSNNNKRRLRRGQNGASSLTSPLMKKVKGRSYRHVELADSWLMQARIAGKSHLRSPILEDLLNQAEQFLWGGHEMDQVREMVEKLNVAHKWVQDVAACSMSIERQGHGGKAVKVPLTTVQRLVTVDPVPWVEPHLQTLKALFEPALKLEQQITKSLEDTSHLEVRALQALQQEASHSHFELPGLQRLKDVLSSVQVWSDRVRKILSSCTKMLRNQPRNDQMDLQQLQSLQLEGLQIPVKVVEKNLLESTIKAVEDWQHRASRLLSSCTVQDLETILRDSESLLVQPEEVNILENRLQNVRKWVLHAWDAMVYVKDQPDYAASMKMLTDLLAEHDGLQVRGLEEVGLLRNELEKVEWMYKTSETLLSRPTIACLQGLVSDICRLGLTDKKFLLQIQSTLGKASAWELQAASLLQRGGPLDDLLELLSSGEGIKAELLFLNPVREAVSQAKSWIDRARPFIQSSSDFPDDRAGLLDIATLEVLVSDSQKLAIVLDEAKLLTTALAESRSWISCANVLKTSVFVSEQFDCQIGCTLELSSKDLGTTECEDGSYLQKEVNGGVMSRVQEDLQRLTKSIDEGLAHQSKTPKLRLEEDLLKLSKCIGEGLALRVQIPEIIELQGLCQATKWSLEALRLVDCSPTVKEVESHLEQVASLPMKLAPSALLQGMLSDAKTWLQAAASFFPGFGIKGSCSEEQLQQLIADAQVLPVSVLSEAACLKDVLSSHRVWKVKVQEALGGTICLTWSDLLKLQEAGEANMVKTEEEVLLNHEVFGAGSWILSCHVAIAKSVDNVVTLEELLLKMKSSVEFAIRYLETDNVKSSVEQTCVCQRESDAEDDDLIHCDSCEEWFHPSCVRLTQAQARGHKQFMCSYCTAVSCGFLHNEDLSTKIHITRRPHLTILRELLGSAQRFRCRIREKELLQDVLELVQFWEKRFRVIVEQTLVCRNGKTAVDCYLLIGACKSVESMEVQDGWRSVLEEALAVNAWRNRGLKLLDQSAKPLPRMLTRAVKEGLAIPISREDSVLQELIQVEACASQWALRAKRVIGDHGDMPVVDVQALIAEGERLPVCLAKELSALKARSLLYCLCRQPYDDERAMIGCDRCGEWYHFSCINLPEPVSSDDDCDDAIQQECEPSGDFVCPRCKESQRDHEMVAEAMAPRSSYRNQVPGDTPKFTGVSIRTGKRSQRSRKRGRGELRHKWQSPLFAPGLIYFKSAEL